MKTISLSLSEVIRDNEFAVIVATAVSFVNPVIRIYVFMSSDKGVYRLF